jgi:hypothetical protein
MCYNQVFLLIENRHHGEGHLINYMVPSIWLKVTSQ